MAGDTERGLALAVQSGIGVAGTPVGMYYMSDQIGLKFGLEKVIREYKTNSRNQRRRAVVTKRYDEMEFMLDVDSVQAGKVFNGAFGAPVSNVYTAFGSTPIYLTAAGYLGISSEWWKMTDGQVAKLVLAMNLTTPWHVKTTLWGPPMAVQSSAWSYNATATADNSPFEAWETVVKKVGASVGVCATDVEITFDNNLKPVWCTPGTAPDTSTDPGLKPTRFSLGVPKVQYKMTLLYTGYGASGLTASELYNYLHNVNGGWIISANMPGYASALEIDMHAMAATTVDVQSNENEIYETVTGEALYNTTDVGYATVTLVPPA